MTTRDLGIVGLRLLGVVLIVNGLAGFSALAGFSVAEIDRMAGFWAVAQVSSSALLLFAGLVLVMAAYRLAAVLFPGGTAAVAGTLGRRELVGVLFAVLGAYVLTEAVPNLVRLGLEAGSLGALDYEYNREHFWRQNWIAIVAEAVRFVLGALLLLGGRTLAAAWVRFRPLARGGDSGETDAS